MAIIKNNINNRKLMIFNGNKFKMRSLLLLNNNYLGIFIFVIINFLFISSQKFKTLNSLNLVEANVINNNNYLEEFKEEQEKNENNYFNEPQPLIFHESGSGLGSGNLISASSNQFNQRPDSLSSSSSSISPSLIMAKCWNNYENDNDCKDLNFITASNSNSNNIKLNNEQKLDDSLITPIVIFESSSPIIDNEDLGNEQQSSEFSGQAYFSSTLRSTQSNYENKNRIEFDGRQNNNNNNNNNNKPPSTANDVYAAPPAGATILLPSTTTTTTTDQQQFLYNNKPYVTTTTMSTPSAKAFTMRPANVFVATPLPKKATKTTTMGRKCRDENDADCDEPEENNSNEDDENVNSLDTHKYKNSDKNKNDDNEETGDDDNGDDDKENNTNNDDFDNKILTNNEFGSGDGANLNNDDNENDDDDLDNNLAEGSGVFESSNVDKFGTTGSSRFVQISTTSFRPPLSIQKAKPHVPTTEITSSQEDRTEATIEVVVHPTLPPTFPITTTTTTSTSIQPQTGDIDENIQLTTSSQNSSTTIMPDDTFKSKPVFPSTNNPSNNNNINEDHDILDSQHEGTLDSMSNNNNIDQATTTTELIDLATFKPIPMPTMEPAYPRIYKNDINSDNNQQSQQNSDNDQIQNNLSPPSGDNGGNNKILDKHKLDTNSVTAAPIKLENPWREKPIKSQFMQQQQDRLVDHSLNNNNNQQQKSRNEQLLLSSTNSRQINQNYELLPNLVSILTIFVIIILLILSIFGIILVKRRKAYRAMLLQKQPLMPSQFVDQSHHAQLIMNSNGIHPQGQLVGSISMAKMQQQQPGLLSTYAPPNQQQANLTRGNAMGKLNNNSNINNGGVVIKKHLDIINGSTEDNEEILADDEDDLMNGLDSNNNNQENDDLDENNNIQLVRRATNKQPINKNRQSSWSTEEQTTSSGSQRTADSSQQAGNHIDNNNNNNDQMQTQRRQYPNSLSDGRQNSSSISDSHSISPDNGVIIPQQQQQQQQQVQYNNPQQMLIQQSYQQQQQQAQFPIFNTGDRNRFPAPSRSVENLHQQSAGNFNNQQAMFINQPISFNNFNKPPPMSPYSSNMNGLPEMPPAPPIEARPPVTNMIYNDHNNQMRPALAFQGQQLASMPQQPVQLAHHHQQQQHPVNSALLDSQFQHQSPINPARIAMNPLATMSRRYPGVGLNRGVYSEDSSSFITASPSLARTSSSSSFAFTNNGGSQLTTPIRGKPFIDQTTTTPIINGANNRIFADDYTQQQPYPISVDLNRKQQAANRNAVRYL